MTGRERVARTLCHEPVDRAPRELWALPGIWMERADEARALLERFPQDFTGPAVRYGHGRREAGSPNEVGQYVDAWGCVWHVAERGVCGEVKEPPIADWSALNSYQPPFELLDEADFSQVNRSCADSIALRQSGNRDKAVRASPVLAWKRGAFR